jgi:hypothetical protein
VLDVQAHKTGHPSPSRSICFGRAVDAWAAIRPTQPLLVDPRTSERVAMELRIQWTVV